MKRIFTLLDSTMINVGTIIGSGIFLVPTTIALYLESSVLIIAVWFVAGLITLLGALSMAELGAAMPKAGGQFIYLREAYSPVWGFLYGWVGLILSGLPAYFYWSRKISRTYGTPDGKNSNRGSGATSAERS